MRSRPGRLLVIAGIVIIAALLALPLRETIYRAVVIPVAFIGWELGLGYRMLPQAVWWWVILIIIFFMLVFSTLPQWKPARREQPKPRPRHGQVEDLAIWMGRSKSGVYFKWLIANRLGKLAYQILLQRETGRPRSVFTPLVGEDWEPASELQNYLETGLHGSFSDFSSQKNPLMGQQKTPLDYEIREAIEFLESQVENERSGKSIAGQ